jgi:hypothetical protein
MVNSFMNKRFVKVVCDVYCNWDGKPPRYRAYVDNELFVERTWIWQHAHLQESFQIEAWPGKYNIRYELLGKHATLQTRNYRVEYGSATVNELGELVIAE